MAAPCRSAGPAHSSSPARESFQDLAPRGVHQGAEYIVDRWRGPQHAWKSAPFRYLGQCLSIEILRTARKSVVLALKRQDLSAPAGLRA